MSDLIPFLAEEEDEERWRRSQPQRPHTNVIAEPESEPELNAFQTNAFQNDSFE